MSYNKKIINMFKNFNELSPSLNKGILLFTERLDMNQRDRELFFDIIKFTFNEGNIRGKEEYLKEINTNSDEQK